ncbi:MAG: serine/threonine-protein kinase [Myxococcota bacterium]
MTTQPRQGDLEAGTAPIDAPASLVNRVLDGRFRLDEILNSGGMGIVYRATQLTVNRNVAVKVLKPTLSSEVDLVKRFSQEIEVVARLSHPNIVTLIDAGKDAGGLTYLAMEFVRGDTFRTALREGQLTLPEMLEVFGQTCDALAEAHQLGIVHRDLKFDNIMLSEHDDDRIHVKVLDFGVAKLLSSNLDLTRSGQVPGTPGIIAPELIDENPPAPQSDLYSLGVLLFTALCGQAPFTGDNDLELMRAHKFSEVPPIEERVSDTVPRELIQLTYDLLEKKPSGRPAQARSVREVLDGICHDLEEKSSDFPMYIPGNACIGVSTGEVTSPRDAYNLNLEAETSEAAGQAQREAEKDRKEHEDLRPSTNDNTLEGLSRRGLERTGLWSEKEEDPGALERFIRSFFGEEPVVAPTTVVFALAVLLMILLVTLLYLLIPFFQG